MLRIVMVLLIMIPMYAISQDRSTLLSVNSSSSPQETTGGEVTPPVARKIHTQKTVNGKTLFDDYAWLRERSNPDVKALLEAENTYAEYVMKPTEERQKKLYEEIVSHIKETRRHGSVPHERLLLLYANREG